MSLLEDCPVRIQTFPIYPISILVSFLNTTKQQLTSRLGKVVRGFNTVDQILRRENNAEERFIPLWRVVAILLVCGPIYGIAMGAYAYVVGARSFTAQVPQLIYSGVKVPMLLGMTVAIAMPSFFVLNSLMGLRDDFGEALRAIVSAQAGLAVILVSLFPLTLFVYASLANTPANHSTAVLFNAAMFGLASVSAQVLLRYYYKPLVSRDLRHRWMIRIWIFVYAFVGIQAAYTLRPFIGGPNAPPEFLRSDSFQNAYLAILRIVGSVFESFVFG